MKKNITIEEAKKFSQELYKELIECDWSEKDALSVSNNIEYLKENVMPYQTPESYADILNM